MRIFIISTFIIFLVVIGCKNGSDPKPDPLSLSLIPTHVSEYDSADGSINLTVAGGSEPYSFNWSNGETTEDINYLTAGIYKVQVVDDDNKTRIDSIQITQPGLLKQLTNQHDNYPRYSPDGQIVVFHSYRDGFCNIWRISASGSTAQKIINRGDSPSWSPNGQQIAFSKEIGNRSDIWLYTLSNSTETKVTLGDVGGSRPSWSPDGTKLVVEFNQDIWIIYLDGSDPVQLTTYSGWDGTPAWSPDGATISFASARSGDHELWTIPASGGDATQKTFLEGYVLYPTWSPDGSTFVFSNLVDPINNIFNIFTLPAVGGNAVELINNSGYDSYPSWSPGGDKVVFSSSDENQGLWLVSVD